MSQKGLESKPHLPQVVPFFMKSPASQAAVNACAGQRFVAILAKQDDLAIPGFVLKLRERHNLLGKMLTVDAKTTDFNVAGVDTLFFPRGDRIPLALQLGFLKGELSQIQLVVAIINGEIGAMVMPHDKIVSDKIGWDKGFSGLWERVKTLPLLEARRHDVVDLIRATYETLRSDARPLPPLSTALVDYIKSSRLDHGIDKLLSKLKIALDRYERAHASGELTVSPYYVTRDEFAAISFDRGSPAIAVAGTLPR